jgi:hypothetical protein
VRTLAVQNPCSRCNKTNKKVQARWRKECLDVPLDAAPCKKAWHSGLKLNDAPKAEWDQWLGANKFALMGRCAPARDHSSVQWINSRSLVADIRSANFPASLNCVVINRLSSGGVFLDDPEVENMIFG